MAAMDSGFNRNSPSALRISAQEAASFVSSPTLLEPAQSEAEECSSESVAYPRTIAGEVDDIVVEPRTS